MPTLSKRHLHPSAPRPSILDQIRIDREPVDIFGRALALVHDAMQARGILLAMGTFEELWSANDSNGDSWFVPLYPTFNHNFGLMQRDKAFWLGGWNASGEVVCSWACRHFDWRMSTYAVEAESLRLMYADAEPHVRRGVVHTADIAPARELTGRVVFEGAGWVRPDYRGKGVMPQLACAAKIAAASRWEVDYFAAEMVDEVIALGLPERIGYHHLQRGLHINNPGVGVFDLALLWMSRREAVAYVQAILDGFLSQVDPAVVGHAG